MKLGQHAVYVSDKVNYLNPHRNSESMRTLFDALREEGLSNVPSDEKSHILNLLTRGLSESEARELFHSEVLAGTQFRDRGLELNTIMAPTMMISYGTVVD